MRKIFVFIIVFFSLIINVSASTNTSHSYILMDLNTGRILKEKNSHDKKLIASITKIMTAIIVIENTDINMKIKIDDSIYRSYGSSIYIVKDEILTIRDLLYGLMLRSGNDAAVMLANHISNSEEEFVKLMNNKAIEIGMKDTIFNNSSGLDEIKGNYSTCYDMALLTKYAMNNKIYREIVSTKKYTTKSNFKSYVWYNKNKLLKYNYITGGKTGYTVKAKRTLVTTANINNMNLVVVTLNDRDDWNTHIELYNYAKDNYSSYKVLSKGKINLLNNIYKEEFFLEEDIYIPFKNTETNNLIKHVKLFKDLKYKDNDRVGIIQILLNNKVIYEDNIYIRIKKRTKNKNIINIIRKYLL